jgi:histidinol-phosphate aminotransferase
MNASSNRMRELFRKEALAFPRYTLKENDTGIRLHQNETLGLSAEERTEFAQVLARALEKSESVNIYPSLEPTRLLQAYAATVDVPAENIEVTSGSSQALTLLAEALFEPGRKVAITSPSFSLYKHLVHLYGATAVDIELDSSFNFDPAKLFSKEVLDCQVAVLCSPNNPTGTLCSPELILKFAEHFRGMLVVDEAYIEFTRNPEQQSFVKQALQRENVVVLRTLSKAWAAAGLRVGAMISHRENISLFRSLKPPYSIAWPSEILACHILENKQQLTRTRIARTAESRDVLKRLLSECTQVETQSDSQANFVFITTPKASELESVLLEQGFIVRRYSAGRLAQAVRISMPPDSEFERLKTVLLEVLR